MNFLGAPAPRRPVGNRKPELAGETPALPGIAPKRFLEAGFKFQFPELPGALKNLFG
jgi:NAD dependent epimerase/dehydratase family enzyme